MVALYFISDQLLRSLGVGDPYGSQELEKRELEVSNVVRISLT